MPAMDTGYAREGGYVTERLIRYYERRAEGGVGLIVVEICGVDPSGVAHPYQLRIDDDKYIEGLRQLTHRLHAHGVPVMLQLHHAGRQMSSRVSGTQPVAPSAIPCPLIREVPRALETDEVDELVRQFARAAVRAKAAGFDGVQIHGAHGYLVHQFLSPLSNKRNDKYGGDSERRMRFPLEIVRQIRAAVGSDFVIGYKISAEDRLEGGLKLDETTAFAQRLQDAGVDVLEVSAGTYAQMHHMIPPMMLPQGYLVPLAAHMKRHLRIPVVAVARINDPELAEQILVNGDADLVAVGRGLLADPDLPRKAQEGRFLDVRRCVACNECIARAFALEDLVCLINPELGREGEVDLGPAAVPKTVLVVGAGPSGIQAALTASQRGHKVILCDRNPWVGGKLPIVQAPPGKHEYVNYTRYLIHQLKQSTVEVRLNTVVTVEYVESLKPDEVIVATGARPEIPDIPGVQGPNVFTAEDLLAEDRAGKHVVIVGASGTGCETAEYLVKHGHQVTIVARSKKAARSIEPITRRVLLEELRQLGVEFRFGLQTRAIYPDRVECVNEQGQVVSIPCDTVVIARGYKPDNRLAEALEARGFSVRRIGDVVAPRKIIDAVTEGYLTGASL